MLFTGLFLLILGAGLAAVGRTREVFLFYAGVLIFVIGAAFLVFWLLGESTTADTSVALFGPLAWAMRKVADRLDGNQSVVIPPGAFCFWAFAPTPSSKQWGTIPEPTSENPTTFRFNQN